MDPCRQPRTRSMAVRALMLTSVIALPCTAEQLIVDVTGIEKLGGKLMVAVYNDASAWDDDGKPVAVASDSVSADTARLVFPELSAGLHAVKLYHDENANGELDSNMLGIPSEGYGFSNNGGRFGPPSFDEASFEISGDTTIEIELQ